MITHVHIQNRAGFERAVPLSRKANRQSSMAISKTDASNETNDAHFLYNLLNLVNSIKEITNPKKNPAPTKI